GAQASGRAAQRWIALLGHPRRSDVPAAPDRHPPVHRQGRRQPMPSRARAQARSRGAPPLATVSGLAVPCQRGFPSRPRPPGARCPEHAGGNAPGAARARPALTRRLPATAGELPGYAVDVLSLFLGGQTIMTRARRKAPMLQRMLGIALAAHALAVWATG